MKYTLKAFCLAVGLGALLFARLCLAQITINELVEDEQDFETTDIPDTREFIELYNAGASAVNIEGWLLNQVSLATGGVLTSDPLPAGASIPAGGYYVIGQAAVPNVNFTPVPGELWTTSGGQNVIFELRNPNAAPGSQLIDAVAVDSFRGVELANATQEQLNQISVGQTAGPDAQGGWWGQLESLNAGADPNLPNLPLSLGRYQDGVDRNRNGYDFGQIPATPGAKNDLTTVPVHQVTDVDALATGSVLRDDYYASFKLPRVIVPGTVDAYNPNTISASPQGGKAIIAWDETGGGNSVHSDEYSNEFKIWAFIDPTPFNVTTVDTNQSEATIYGIAGTTDPLFGTPNSADLLTGQPGTGGNITSSANGSTGLGWVIQRRTSNVAGTQNSKAVVQLVDFNDGGDGVLADAPDWDSKQIIEITGQSAGWHVLGVKYDPATGAVVATYDTQTFNFNTTTGLVGNFYIGYREQLPSTGAPVARPPTYDLYVETPAGVAGDYNNNGVVDAADYVLWRNGGPLQNDPTAGVQAADYDFWRSRIGATSGSGSAAAVPEPATIGLLVIAAAFSGWRRRS